jgi:predicted nucleotidyltransferase
MKPSIEIREKRERILDIAKRHGARNVRVFGSVARGEDTERSDLDLLVDMDEDRPLSDLGEFVEDVRGALKCKVQAVTSDSLNRLLKERILSEARPI